MAKSCDVCEKEYMKGNLVPRGIGRRVTNRAIRRQKPNLRRKKITVNGTPIRVNICAACLKRIKFNSKKLKQQDQATTQA